jgi:cysteine desulfuration protein SufE
MSAPSSGEPTPPGLPAPLEALVVELEALDRDDRFAQLIAWADEFVEVPATVATRPFPEASRVQRCESEAFVFAVDAPDGTLDFYFAVDSPYGLAAKAWAVILGRTCSRQPLSQVVRISEEVIFRIFGRELSMGKGQGLAGMLGLVTHAARARLTVRRVAGLFAV